MARWVGIPALFEVLKGEGVNAGASSWPNAIEDALEVDVREGREGCPVGLGRIRWSVSTTYESRNVSSDKQSPSAARLECLFAPLKSLFDHGSKPFEAQELANS